MTTRPTILARPDWRHVEPAQLDDFTAEDWAVLRVQKAEYYREHQATELLRMLAASEHAPSFGYQVNNFRHCVQSASMVLRDGHDEETVVVALLHDIGFVACPTVHGAFAATLLAPYVSEANVWMLRHHQIFLDVHCATAPDARPDGRERWRGHPHFAWTAEFVARYDQTAIRAEYDDLPLAAFEPLVRRIFARAPQPIPTD